MAKRSTLPPAEAEVTGPREEPTPNGLEYLHHLATEAERQRTRPTLLEQMAGEDGQLFPGVVYDQVSELNCSDLYPSDDQGRQDWGDLEELGRNIKEHGLQEPVILRYSPRVIDGKHYLFQLVAGERRWRAHLAVGLRTIQAIVRRLDDRQAAGVHLLENMQRRDLNPIEEAREFRAYLDRTGTTQAELGRLVGKKQASIANALRLLECPQPVRQMVISGDITAYHARLLLGLDPDAGMAGGVYVDNFSVGPSDIAEKAKEMSSTQLERAVRAINADVKRKKQLLAKEEERRQRLEAERARVAAALAEAGGGGSTVLVAPDRWTAPAGCDSVPSMRLRSGQRMVESDCEGCAKRVMVAYPERGEEPACTDSECRTQVYERLRAAVEERERAEDAHAVELVRTLEEGLTPVERRRLALYQRAWGRLYNDDQYSTAWQEIGEEPSEELLTKESAHAVIDRLARNTHQRAEMAVRTWISERFGIDEILPPAAATPGDAPAPEAIQTETGERLVCRECGRVSTDEDPDEDWEQDDLCAACADKLMQAQGCAECSFQEDRGDGPRCWYNEANMPLDPDAMDRPNPNCPATKIDYADGSGVDLEGGDE